MIDPTKYFVCKVCGSIHEKTEKIKLPDGISIYKTGTGSYLFKQFYCLDCVSLLINSISEHFSCYPESTIAINIKKEIKNNTIASFFKKELESHLKNKGFPFSTIEEHTSWIKKQDEIAHEARKKYNIKIFSNLQELKQNKQPSTSWWRNLWSKK